MKIDTSRFHHALLIGILVFSCAAQALEKDIETDILVSRITGLLKAERYVEALPLFEKLEGMDTRLPESFDYYYIETLDKAGKVARAVESSEAYLKKYGKKGKYYGQVIEIVGRRQIDAEKERAGEEVRLAKEKAEQARLKAEADAAETKRNLLAQRQETEHWKRAEAAKDAATVQGYLDRYPSGRYVTDAQAKLASVKKAAREGAVRSQAMRPRVALVIGNSRYQHVPSLATSINDAADVAGALDKLGFQVFTSFGVDRASMRKAIGDFSAMLKTDGYRNALAVFYYVGHGTQSSGRNFLLPVDFRLNSISGFDGAVDLNEEVMQPFSRMATGARPGPNVIILDASRDDPLGGRPGLSRVEVPSGTLLAFSAAAGQAAIEPVDGTKAGRNGIFARILVEELGNGTRVDMEKFFKGVKRKVYEATVQRQDPLIMPNLLEDAYFVD